MANAQLGSVLESTLRTGVRSFLNYMLAKDTEYGKRDEYAI